MTLLLRALSLCIPLCRASLPGCNGTTIPILDVSASPSSCNTRTLWEIILSCALTLFACTWTAVHPNIPGMKEGIVAITSRRLFLMVMALIAPELMVTWSARQFFSARQAEVWFKSPDNAELKHRNRRLESRMKNSAVHGDEGPTEDAATSPLLPQGSRSHEMNCTNLSSSTSKAQDVQFIGQLHAFGQW